ncbi:MAG: hypothetical protein IPM97_02195 [Bdellovibrionaceae bacterium]|nr:hypothetical protein [Pseudobdellovibrionaceae bacterium]
METIPFDTIQSAIDNVCSINTEEQLDQISQDLFEAQPGLAGFLIEFIEDMGDGAKDLGFMMALVLWKSFQEKYPHIRALSEDEVVARFEEQEADLEKLLQVDEDMIEEMQKAEALNGQPEVFNYVTQELFGTAEDEIELSDDEEVHLFMVLRFFSTCLNDLAKETSSPLKH